MYIVYRRSSLDSLFSAVVKATELRLKGEEVKFFSYFEGCLFPLDYDEQGCLWVGFSHQAVGKLFPTEANAIVKVGETLLETVAKNAVSAGMSSTWGQEVMALAQALGRFEACEKHVPMDQQLLIYKNMNAAKRFIADQDAGAFRVQQPTSADQAVYFEFLNEIKTLVKKNMDWKEFKYKGRTFMTPFINADTNLSPWIQKIVSLTYDDVIVAEVLKGLEVYSIFSRFEGNAEFLQKSILKENGIVCQ